MMVFRTVLFAAATAVLLSGCSSGPAVAPSQSSVTSTTATPSVTASFDPALQGRLDSFLLHEDDIQALRTSQDGPEQWRTAGLSDPPDTRYQFPEITGVDPNRCADVVKESYNFEIAAGTGFSQYRRLGPEGSGYGIIQTVIAYPDSAAAQRALANIADKVRQCGTTSGTISVRMSDIISGPFSVEARDVDVDSLRWTFVSRLGFIESTPEYSTEVALAVAKNMVVGVSTARFTDADHLATALMQAVSQRIASAR